MTICNKLGLIQQIEQDEDNMEGLVGLIGTRSLVSADFYIVNSP